LAGFALTIDSDLTDETGTCLLK